MSQFYALMSDNTVKHISLKEEIVTEIKNIFINGGAIFKPEGIEEDVFDGNIISRNGENITYIMTYLKILLAYHIIRLICLNTI
jgi:hypothetical protein